MTGLRVELVNRHHMFERHMYLSLPRRPLVCIVGAEELLPEMDRLGWRDVLAWSGGNLFESCEYIIKWRLYGGATIELKRPHIMGLQNYLTSETA